MDIERSDEVSAVLHVRIQHERTYRECPGETMTTSDSSLLVLVGGLVARVTAAFDLLERSGPGRGPAAMLVGVGSLAHAFVGTVRFYDGAELDRLVIVDVAVKPLGLEWRGVYAFSPPDGVLPHLLLEAGRNGNEHFWRIDLLPRVELAAEPDWVDAVYEPLTISRHAVSAWPILRPVATGPRMGALLSPWCLSHSGPQVTASRLGPVIDIWVDQWFALAEVGLPAVEPGAIARLRMRDRLHKEGLFQARIDPIWAVLERAIGDEQAGWIRRVLRGEL